MGDLMKACPPPERLQKLLSDQLGEDEERSLDAHVRGCAACLQYLETLTHIAKPSAQLVPPKEESAYAQRLAPEDALAWRGIAGRLTGSNGRGRPTTAAQPAPEIAGFEILGKLGHGGMGIVYKARQLDLQRTVAIKMILAGVHAQEQSLARFRAEAEAVAQLQHPNIVQIYAVGEAAGLPYFSLEFVEGGTLAQQLSGTPLPPRRAAQLVEVLARAVHYAHVRGIVHRDLKPANVLLTLEGAPKIADFGLAKRRGSDPAVPSTLGGLTAGTPPYMAPEQLRPQAAGEKRSVGPASDIYALGAILFELLTGRPLYTGDSALDVVVRVLHEDPTPPRVYCPGLPRDLDTICLKCLAKNPLERFASAEQLSADLDSFLRGQPIRARPPSFLYRSSKFMRRNKTLVVAALAVTAALAAGIVATSVAAFRELQQRARAESNARQAESARQQALLEAYQARLAAALSALSDHNTGEAANQLKAVPEERRGWEWHYAASRLDDSVYSLRGVPEWLVPFADGRRVAAASPEGMCIWDISSGALLATIPGPRPEGIAVLTTPAGPLFVEWDQQRMSLRSETGQVLQRFAVPRPSPTHAIAVDPAGARLARAGVDETGAHEELTIFDMTTGKALRRCSAPRGELRGLAFSPDGRRLAGGGDDRSVQIWDADSGASLGMFQGHKGFVRSVIFHPDGRRILSASADGSFRQWDAATGMLLDQRYGHEEQVHTAIYSPNGKWIISGGGDGTVRYWDLDGGPALSILHGHVGPVTGLTTSPDGQRVTSASMDHSARIFDGPDMGDARVLRGHTSFVYPVAYSPNGLLLASGGWDAVVRLWDTETGLPVGVLSGHKQYVASLAFSPDSRRLVSRGADGAIRIWDVAARKEVAVLPHGHLGYADKPHGIAITPDGRRVACAGDDRLYFWDLQSGTDAGSLELPVKATRVAAIRPDGQQMAVIGAGQDIYLIDAGTGSMQATLQGHEDAVHDVSFSHDGRRLVSASMDRTLRVWDTATGQCLQVLRGHTGTVFAAVFHPDGTRIASGGRDRAIRIWDAASGSELARLHGHTDYVFSLQFSPDGASLASGSGDYTVRLWDTFPVARRLKKRAQTTSNVK
jgi:eukaryotic-like serine/threonine-protein kinase